MPTGVMMCSIAGGRWFERGVESKENRARDTRLDVSKVKVAKKGLRSSAAID